MSNSIVVVFLNKSKFYRKFASIVFKLLWIFDTLDSPLISEEAYTEDAF